MMTELASNAVSSPTLPGPILTSHVQAFPGAALLGKRYQAPFSQWGLALSRKKSFHPTLLHEGAPRQRALPRLQSPRVAGPEKRVRKNVSGKHSEKRLEKRVEKRPEKRPEKL